MFDNHTFCVALWDSKYSEESFAEELGVSLQTVYRWCFGETQPMPYNFNRICSVLGLSWRELAFGKRKKQTQRILCEE